ncbi:hypothetical protein TCAL_16505 [Tigriopus californicus]|uniref:Reverse transcriptase domain-containing protein n=1 Tax=Tigriopus californicus TaxID=6832 RepID=A0A553NUI8_TIGCA|nr:hypothetical protein TCAL_16505 [Tigriopus californicus]
MAKDIDDIVGRLSLASCPGKLVETSVRNQMNRALSDQGPSELHGFRQGRGTSTALMQVTEDIKEARQKGKKVILVAIDASAAFDLISREYLMETLKTLGAGTRLIRWFENFFKNRGCFVEVEGQRSDVFEPSTGVIRGGPSNPDCYGIGSISLIYWVKEVMEALMALYADDGFGLAITDTLEECQQIAQSLADRISEWFLAFGLSLNEKKSEVVGFGCVPRPIKVGSTDVQPTDSIRFLGCHLQEDMKWDKQKYLGNLHTSSEKCGTRMFLIQFETDSRSNVHVYEHIWFRENEKRQPSTNAMLRPAFDSSTPKS